MSTESGIDKRAKQYSEEKYGRKYIRKIGSGSNGRTGVYLTEKRLASITEDSALKVVCVIERRGTPDDYTPEEMDFFRDQRKKLIDSSVAEVAIMQKLGDSKNIVSYLDFDAIDYQNEESFGTDLAIRMQLLHNLAETMEQKEFSWQEIIRIGMHLCNALRECHENRIIHRDIKPANIFYDEGDVYKLGDFGVSKILRHSLTENAPIGTFSYAAPEQVKGDNYDHRIDIYSLGLVLYELANHNRLPFAKTSQAQTSEINKRLHHTEKLPAPPDIPKRLSAVIVKACSYSPDDRYKSAHAFYEALRAAREQILKDSEEKKTGSQGGRNTHQKPSDASKRRQNTQTNQNRRQNTQNNRDYRQRTTSGSGKLSDSQKRKKKKDKTGSVAIIACGILAVAVIILVMVSILKHVRDHNQNETETQAPGKEITIVSGGESYEEGSGTVENGVEVVVAEEEEAVSAISSYELYLEDVSWDRAYLSCQEKGGHLLRIETEEEMAYIIGWLDEQNILSDGSKLLYLSAQRQLDSQNYYWVNDAGELSGDTPINASGSWTSGYWYLNEPSFRDGDTDEYCLDLFNKDGYWYLNDVPGDIVAYASMYAGKVGYICEYEAQNSPSVQVLHANQPRDLAVQVRSM